MTTETDYPRLTRHEAFEIANELECDLAALSDYGQILLLASKGLETSADDKEALGRIAFDIIDRAGEAARKQERLFRGLDPAHDHDGVKRAA